MATFPGVQAALALEISVTLARLPPIYRQVLVMRDIEEMTAPEVATTLGVPVEAAFHRFHRARAMLRTELKEWVEP